MNIGPRPGQNSIALPTGASLGPRDARASSDEVGGSAAQIGDTRRRHFEHLGLQQRVLELSLSSPFWGIIMHAWQWPKMRKLPWG